MLWTHTHIFKRTVCLSLQNMPYLLMIQAFLSRKRSTACGNKWKLLSIKSAVSFCSGLLSRHATKKQTPPYRVSMAQPVKIEFRLAPLFIGSIQDFIGKTSAFQYISPRLFLFFPAVLMGLLSGPCSLLLPCKLVSHQVWPLHPRFLRATTSAGSKWAS